VPNFRTKKILTNIFLATDAMFISSYSAIYDVLFLILIVKFYLQSKNFGGIEATEVSIDESSLPQFIVTSCTSDSSNSSSVTSVDTIEQCRVSH